jgi:hypothetical protein
LAAIFEKLRTLSCATSGASGPAAAHNPRRPVAKNCPRTLVSDPYTLTSRPRPRRQPQALNSDTHMSAPATCPWTNSSTPPPQPGSTLTGSIATSCPARRHAGTRSPPRPTCGWQTSPRCLTCPCPAGLTPTVHTPDGPGPRIHDLTQLCQLIAIDQTAAILPESFRTQLGDDLAAVPVLDGPTVIAWPLHCRSRAVGRLIQAATHL